MVHVWTLLDDRLMGGWVDRMEACVGRVITPSAADLFTGATAVVVDVFTSTEYFVFGRRFTFDSIASSVTGFSTFCSFSTGSTGTIIFSCVTVKFIEVFSGVMISTVAFWAADSCSVHSTKAAEKICRNSIVNWKQFQINSTFARTFLEIIFKTLEYHSSTSNSQLNDLIDSHKVL